MIECPKCHNQNDLGRVFCTECGTKLPTQQITSDVLDSKLQANAIKRFWYVPVILIVLWIVAQLVLAFTPQSQPIGDKGTLIGARRIEKVFADIGELPKGQTLKIELEEKDVNGYFEQIKAGRMGFSLVSFDFDDQLFNVRIVRTLARFRSGPMLIEPKISYDLVCLPYGGAIAPKTVKMGRLKLSGPFRNSAIRKLFGAFRSQPEFKHLAEFDEVEIVKGKVTASVKK